MCGIGKVVAFDSKSFIVLISLVPALAAELHGQAAVGKH
jgi:hypothetical protein